MSVLYVNTILDEILGEDNFRNEVHPGTTAVVLQKDQWARKHDNVFYYSSGPTWTFNVDAVRQPYKWVDGQKRDGSGRDLEKGKLPDDAFDLHGVMPWAGEKTGDQTQKPSLSLSGLSKPPRTRATLSPTSCGSGTTLAVAQRLGRRWIGCDLGRWGTHVTRKRLLGIENCKPFEVLDLGRYERQYRQGVTFGETKDKPRAAEQAFYEYLAFIYKSTARSPWRAWRTCTARRAGP